MNVETTKLDGVLIIEPQRFGDERGWFTETYSQASLAGHGFTWPFVQDNHSFSAEKGTVRGLHFQIAPHAQDKLVRCSRGSIFDVSLDIRHGSSSFGEHIAVELSAENGHQLLVPAGFAHAFCTLEPDCEVQYKVSDIYAPDCERGILWCDPALGIDWPVSPEDATLSGKDQAYPGLRDLPEYFTTA